MEATKTKGKEAQEFRRRAMYILGRIMHIRQDIVFHRWVDMAEQHTADACKIVRNWLWVFGYWAGKKADLRDHFPSWETERAAEKATLAVLEEFENRLTEKYGQRRATQAIAPLK